MAIIISRGGKNAQRLDPSYFDSENYLQQYIYDNPESIPLYEIKEDIRLLILAREYPTNSGPIDALGVDKDGDIYLVETKLYKNPDKRTVVAQVLDYGASLWKSSIDFNDFTGRLNDGTQKQFNLGLNQKLTEFFDLDESELENLLSNMQNNLNKGNFQFVVLMDKLHAQLKDLMIFINENSRFTVYAVELEYYKYENHEILIPKLFGAEVKKDVRSSSSSSRQRWNEQSMLEDARDRLGEDARYFEQFYNFCKDHADQINFGTGVYGSFSPIFEKISPRSLVTLSTDKRMALNFDWFAKDNEQAAVRFKTSLEKLGFTFSEDYLRTRPAFPIEEWGPKVGEILGIIQELV